MPQANAQAAAKQPPVEQDKKPEETFEQAFSAMAKDDKDHLEQTPAPEQPPQGEDLTGGDGGGGEDVHGEEIDTQQAGDKSVDKTPEELWAGLNEKQRAALGDLTTRLTNAEHAIASANGRAQGFQRRVEEMQREAAQKTQSAVASGGPAVDVSAMLKDLKADYPTIAGPVEAAIKATLEATVKHVNEVVTARVTPLLQRATQDEQDRHANFIKEQAKILSDAHPDWAKVKETPEFRQWVGKKPAGFQSMLRSQNAADAVLVLDLYKSETSSDDAASVQERRKARLQQAASSQGSSGRAAAAAAAAGSNSDTFEAAWVSLGRQSAAGQKK